MCVCCAENIFFFSSRRRHTRYWRDWSSDVCSSDLKDRNILRSSSKQDISALGPEIQTLMPGECLLANLEAPFAVPAKVHLYDQVVRDCVPPPPPRATAPPNVAALVD